MGIVSEDRKTEGLALSLSIGNNLTLSKLKGMGPVGLIFSTPAKQDCKRVDPENADQVQRTNANHQRRVRRKPAENRHRPIAASRCRRAFAG